MNYLLHYTENLTKSLKQFPLNIHHVFGFMENSTYYPFLLNPPPIKIMKIKTYDIKELLTKSTKKTYDIQETLTKPIKTRN